MCVGYDADRTNDSIGLDAGQDDTARIQRLGTLHRRTYRDGGKPEQRAFLTDRATIGQYAECVFLQLVVIVETEWLEKSEIPVRLPLVEHLQAFSRPRVRGDYHRHPMDGADLLQRG